LVVTERSGEMRFVTAYAMQPREAIARRCAEFIAP
jgi:hypothetical protein